MRPGSRSACALHDTSCNARCGLYGFSRSRSSDLFGRLAILAQNRREDFGDEDRLGAIAKARTSRPQSLWCVVGQLHGFDGGAKEFVAFVKSPAMQFTAHESGVGKEQGAKRTTAQARKPAGEWAARTPGKDGMREDYRLAVTEQCDFAHPGQAAGLDTQKYGFIEGRRGETLVKGADSEATARLQTGRQ